MRAVTWQGHRHVQVEEVPDPVLEQPTDAIIRVTSSGICGSDLHLYEVLGPYLAPGDILGHEAMGVVEEVGAEASAHLSVGDRVVVPCTIACGCCWMCARGLYAHCETTQVREHDRGAAMFGYSRLYGQVPGGQAEYLRVPQAQFGPMRVPDELPEDRALFLSDILPTAWQAVEYAKVPYHGTIAVLGLGPVGQLCLRLAFYQNAARVVAADLVPERIALARAWGAEVIDLADCEDPAEEIRALTEGRGADAVIDAVGLEAHGSPAPRPLPADGGGPDVADGLLDPLGFDRLGALEMALRAVRRGGTVSLAGVYGGGADPLPLGQMFDRGIQLRMGQCHVRHWTDRLLEIVTERQDILGLDDFVTHHLPLADAPAAYEMFQAKKDGCLKVVLHPQAQA